DLRRRDHRRPHQCLRRGGGRADPVAGPEPADLPRLRLPGLHRFLVCADAVPRLHRRGRPGRAPAAAAARHRRPAGALAMIDFIIYSTTMISIWAVLGLSLNLQFGLTGLVNFGQVMPFAVGAYGAAFAATHGLPAWAGFVTGICLAPLFVVLVILPARRLTQDYWALITLGAGELFRLTMENVPVIAGGIEGASVHRLGDRTL